MKVQVPDDLFLKGLSSSLSEEIWRLRICFKVSHFFIAEKWHDVHKTTLRDKGSKLVINNFIKDKTFKI